MDIAEWSRYRNRYRREPDGWRFVDRRATVVSRA
jgi:hypothetical protein